MRCDPSGRLNGRGAYLSLEEGCVQKAVARGILSRQLRVTIGQEKAASLIAQVERERESRLHGSGF